MITRGVRENQRVQPSQICNWCFFPSTITERSDERWGWANTTC